MSRLSRTLAALSQLTNVVLFDGHEDEMVSSRAYREQWKLEAILDTVFGKGHCKQSYEWEQARNHPRK